MSRKSPIEITYPQLTRFLTGLGFEQAAAGKKSQALVHRKSGTVLILAKPPQRKPVRRVDLLSVIVRLESEGLASESDLQQFRQGKLPEAS
ncbi:MAG: hypothetical protein WD872_08640 [Pirellulaceae bacterium]